MDEVSVSVYGSDSCPETQRVRRRLDALSVTYHYVNIDNDPAAEDTVRHWNHGKRRTPTVEFTVGQEKYRLAVPSDEALEAELRQNGLVPKAGTRKAG